MERLIEYKANLEDVKFHKDKDNNYYLSLKYEIKESDGSVSLLTIPNVGLHISLHSINISNDFYDMTINCGFGNLPVRKGQVKTTKGKIIKNVYYVKETIKEAPPKEMTLDEIEKRLGCKVKIVNK